MDIARLIDKAKQWISANPDKVNKGLDKGGKHIIRRFGHDSQVDSGIDQVRRRVTGGDPEAPGREADGPPAGGAPPPPPPR